MKRKRFTMPLPHPSVHFWEESRVEEESEHDHGPSQFDGDDEDGQDEEAEQVEEESQRNRDILESEGDEEEGMDRWMKRMHEQVEEDVEEDQGQEEIQSDQQPLESAGDDEEGHGEEEEQGEDVSERDGFLKGSSKLAAPPSKRTVMANLTLDEDLLDCGVCFFPLKRPIFQCDVGHVVCSSCRDKLAAAGMCHVCHAFGYRRCHAMEQLLESIRVSCPNAAYGCDARIAYYDQHAHLRECRHAPCHCPAEACGFVGSKAVLLDHFTGAHKWTCTETNVWEGVDMDLHDGFNVVAVVDGTNQYIFLLNVAQKQFGRAVSALCIQPQAAVDESSSSSSSSPSKNPECKLRLEYSRFSNQCGDLCCHHYQASEFKVACTDLSNGLPNPDQDCFQFIVPNSVLPARESSLNVGAWITIE